MCSCLEATICKEHLVDAVLTSVVCVIGEVWRKTDEGNINIIATLGTLCDKYHDILNQDDVERVYAQIHKACEQVDRLSTIGVIHERELSAMIAVCGKYFQEPLENAWAQACMKPARREENKET